MPRAVRRFGMRRKGRPMRKIFLPALFTLFLILPAAAQTIESVYTDFNIEKCRHVPGTEQEDYGVWYCKGYHGIPIFVSAGDQRTQISYGRNAEKQPAARTTFARFNTEGDKIEWRLEARGGKKIPFATIMAWNTVYSTDNGDLMHGHIFVVTTLGKVVCHVGYVDGEANKDAAELARRIADEHARSFDCKKDKAIVLGKKGPGFSEANTWDEN
jgi:hypothetical protein